MKYRVNDRVRIKSIDWYNKNKDNYGAIYAGNGFCFWKNMTRHCGEIMKITTVKVDPEDSNKGFYFMENSDEKWTDGMIEGLVEEKNNACQKCVFAVYDGKPHCGLRGFRSDFNVERCSAENDTIPNGYELQKDGYFSWVEKKKKEYPKTYEECCKVLNIAVRDLDILDNMLDTTEIIYSKNLDRLLNSFRKLFICRDAYWKIAGEEMGLDKPWRPDWTNLEYDKFCIWVDVGDITFRSVLRCQHILAFPTEEMRDAFYENFKELIETVKELL